MSFSFSPHDFGMVHPASINVTEATEMAYTKIVNDWANSFTLTTTKMQV